MFASASVITALLQADRVDRLTFTVFPTVVGEGPMIFPDGMPAGAWTLASARHGSDGTLALVYDRAR